MQKSKAPARRRAGKISIAAASVCLAAGMAAAAPVAHTQYGRVTGIVSGSLDEFLGIRYAAPPVGPLRWQPPQALPVNLATKMATAYGPHCAQLASAYGIASTAEDCLYLNVFRPAHRRAGAPALPVMVWIHGGALVVGESDLYDPTPLIQARDVIVVTLNYRLGYLGYLAESGLDAEGHTADNYGLMDQQAALNFVQRNIAGFGGDPGNVTVFGESAGGLSTLSNLISPASHGLFNKALVESGSYSIQLPTQAQAEPAGDAIATSLGCTPADTACLRAVPVTAILAQQTSPTLSLTTIVDGTLLPLSINKALSTGHFNRVPLVNGSNHDEYRQFLSAYAGLTAAQYPAALDGVFGTALGGAVAAAYPVGRYPLPVLGLAAAITDYSFACPANLIDKWASRYVPTYAYEFNDRHAPEDFLPPSGYPFGASHASELQFLFGIPKLAGTRPLNAAELSLSSVMRSYWTNFAATSSPSGNGGPTWLPFAPRTNNMQSLAPPSAKQETDFTATHRCRFWEPVINP